MAVHTMEELKAMAEEYCKLKEVERKVQPRLKVLKEVFEKNLNPGESVQCKLGTVSMTKKGKPGFKFLTKEGETEMETFRQLLCKKGMANFIDGNPYIECKLSTSVE